MSRWKDSSPEQKKKLTENVQRWRKNKIRKLKELFGGKCSICGYNRCWRALEFHHTNPEDKSFAICSEGLTYSWARLLAEAKKCILICANCHREVEDGL